MKRSGLFLMIAVVCMFFASESARADLVISVLDAVIPQGSPGFVDVSIASSDPGNPNVLAGYSFIFQVTPSPTNPDISTAALSFDDQNNLYHDDSRFQTHGNGYVFPANETLYSNGDKIGTALGTSNNQFTGSDNAADPNTGFPANVIVPSTGKLLTRLLLTPDTFPYFPNVPQAGDTFTIDIVPNDARTYFRSWNGDPSNPVPNMDVPFSVIPGTVTIGPAFGPVPEPGTMALLGAGGLLLLAGRSWNRRRADVG